MTACAILALIALVTGPNSTRLRLVQFMPVACACTCSHAISYTNCCSSSFSGHDGILSGMLGLIKVH